MRRIIVAAAATALIGPVAAACGSTSSSSTASGGSSSAASTASKCTNASIQNELYTKGVLTVATDNPVYTPWFVKNKPSNGQGYESAVAYAIAHQLGFSSSQVTWVTEPFSSSYAPGPKKFDFDINEISYTPQRAQAVTFSTSYYDVQQAIVALKGSPIVTHHTPADLKKYLYGDQVGTTGLTYITNNIQPAQQPKVFDTLSEVSAALEAHRIDALITDTPTAQYMASAQLKHAVLVAQFPSVASTTGCCSTWATRW
jgi:polar amino acid transport system substrate-binding protein